MCIPMECRVTCWVECRPPRARKNSVQRAKNARIRQNMSRLPENKAYLMTFHKNVVRTARVTKVAQVGMPSAWQARHVAETLL